MSGIIGYLGEQEAFSKILAGLKKLDDRGYDYTKISVLNQGKLQHDSFGGLLANGQDSNNLTGSVGVGITTWQTHRRLVTDGTEKFTVVQNGFIEHQSVDGNDTVGSTITHLLEENYRENDAISINRAIQQLNGAFALIVIHSNHPEQLFVGCQKSPLLIGRSVDGVFVVNDFKALPSTIEEVYILNSGETGILSLNQCEFFDQDLKPIEKTALKLIDNQELVTKLGFDHFMLKEICEQPQALQDTVQACLREKDGEFLVDPNLKLSLTDVKKIHILGMGTARHAGLLGKDLIEKILRIPVEVHFGSEFAYSDPIVNEDHLTIVISQSGETADTLAGLREAKRKGSRILAITNVIGSSIAREADDVFYTLAGREIAIASTKAYLAQITALLMITLYVAQQQKIKIDQELLKDLLRIPSILSRFIDEFKDFAKDLANRLKDERNIFYLGRGLDYAVVAEGCLKLKETTYIHAEAYSAGEFRHGTIALVEEGFPVISVACTPQVHDKLVKNLEEVKERGAFLTVLTTSDTLALKNLADRFYVLPVVNDLLTPLISVVALQLIAYHTALAKGNDVDKPRNLTKSITSE